jgi:hypothetical protein
MDYTIGSDNDASLDEFNDMDITQQNLFQSYGPNEINEFMIDHNTFNGIEDNWAHLLVPFEGQKNGFSDHGINMHDPNFILGEEQNLNLPQHPDIQSGQITFGSNYNDAEVAHLKEDVSNCQYEVNHLKDEVHHHENLVSLSQDKKSYPDEVADLNEIQSKYNNAVDRLNNAIEKLNNAT